MNQSLVTYSEVICLVTSNLVKDDGKNCVPLLTPRGIILTHRRGGHGFTTTCSSVVAAAGAAFAARRRLINNCGVWRDAAGDGVSRLGTGSGTCGWKRRHRSPRIPLQAAGVDRIASTTGRVVLLLSVVQRRATRAVCWANAYQKMATCSSTCPTSTMAVFKYSLSSHLLPWNWSCLADKQCPADYDSWHRNP